MPDLLDDLRDLARTLAACDDEDVRDSAIILCRQARRRRLAVTGLLTVDAMVRDAPDLDENDPRLTAVHEWLRDSLRELLRWARATERMP